MSEISLKILQKALQDSGSILRSYKSAQYNINGAILNCEKLSGRVDSIISNINNIPELDYLNAEKQDLLWHISELKDMANKLDYVYKSTLVHLEALQNELEEAEKDIQQAVSAEGLFEENDILPWDM